MLRKVLWCLTLIRTVFCFGWTTSMNQKNVWHEVYHKRGYCDDDVVYSVQPKMKYHRYRPREGCYETEIGESWKIIMQKRSCSRKVYKKWWKAFLCVSLWYQCLPAMLAEMPDMKRDLNWTISAHRCVRIGQKNLNIVFGVLLSMDVERV